MEKRGGAITHMNFKYTIPATVTNVQNTPLEKRGRTISCVNFE
jgi:hypothetical protein